MNKLLLNLGFKWLIGIIATSFACSASAQNRIERRFAQGTDAAAGHLFLINPATVQPVRLQAGFVLLRGSSDSTFRTERNSNLSERKTAGQDDVVGAAIVTDFGAGLGVGLNYVRSFRKVQTTALNATTPRVETAANQFLSGRAVVEMSEFLRIGIAVRYLQIESSILGNLFVRDSDHTVYRGALFGIGGGFMIERSALRFGMVYHPALKGKTDIYGEEFIISDPGVAEAAGSFVRGATTFGWAIRRNLYKLDDRFRGTTLNDGNQTRIDLFGLDVEDNKVFFKNHFQGGIDQLLSNGATLRFSLARETLEFNFDPDEILTGLDDDHETLNFLRGTFSYHAEKGSLGFEFGVNYYTKDHAFSRRTGNQINFSGQGRGVFVVVSKNGL